MIKYEIVDRHPDGAVRVNLSAPGRKLLDVWTSEAVADDLKPLLDGKTFDEALVVVRGKLAERDRHMRLADRLNLALSKPLTEGLAYVSDAYALRDKIRKAKHFRVDAKGSAYIAEASLAIASHLDEARELARAPYPTMWVEIDNIARLERMRALGLGLTARAKGLEDGGAVSAIGWLIERHPQQLSAHRATYFTHANFGCFMAPCAFTWDCEGRECPWPAGGQVRLRHMPEADFLLGMNGAKCGSVWATGGWCSPMRAGDVGYALLKEFAGELRHIFGFLTTIGHVPTEEREIIRVDGDVSQPPPVVKGKPVFALVHHDIIIKLPKHRDIAKIVTRVCEGMRKRRHEVRGHWRHFYNADGSIRRRVWIKEHERGDALLGRVHHDYRVAG